MKRRELLAAGAAAAVAGCAGEQADCGPGTFGERFNWKLVTTWPPNFPGLGTGVNRMVDMIERASAGA